jgi:hypothetical protein
MSKRITPQSVSDNFDDVYYDQVYFNWVHTPHGRFFIQYNAEITNDDVYLECECPEDEAHGLRFLESSLKIINERMAKKLDVYKKAPRMFTLKNLVRAAIKRSLLRRKNKR